ncbi:MULTISPECIES: plasmid partitioning protein RepA [Rhizobium]|uniref:plasmid partitioning protein RepA n=1 Tax=Rhizobium TaxID=379 RepID=UPI001A980D90|nr:MULTISPECIES: plasmid partitioning protein RepA [Rhizobium]MBX4893441.1 plasmid partitioning protein RepA [Rhizobium bangladeshense]MBX4918089.1 plasmid partitioning protein RepA [Rhizobium bangladeshense]MBX4921975.1 plasmid partitioning protein RepA [Rhizobium bangladeshense]MBX4935430.1 plasmid partitioning protein RepA [Rhizobium bangladeshense]MBX5139269.1 plasmid partitioning protein RepA [Rhizobium lentis]
MPQSEKPDDEERIVKRVRRHSDSIWASIKAQGVAARAPLPDLRILRSFSLGEVAEILGVSGSYLRQLSIDGQGPTPELGTAGRRSYTLVQINELRNYLASARPKEALRFCPRRREGDKLQIISVVAGPASTTTSFYLAQGLALQGFRVLAIDLDSHGSLSRMFGFYYFGYPVHNASIYAAIRFDEDQESMRSAIQPTLFDGLDLVPGSAELSFFEEECGRRFRSEKLRYPDASIRMVSALKEVEADYDVVVLACGDGGFLTAGAYEAATGVLVTVRPEMPEIVSMTSALYSFTHFVSLIEKSGRPVKHDFFKYLVTRHDPRDVSQQKSIAMLREALGDDLLTATVWESDAIRQARDKGQSLYDLSSGAVGRSSYEQAMKSLNSANAEIMDIIFEVWGRAPFYVSMASRSTTAGKASSESRG